jgi:hypothetical protein
MDGATARIWSSLSGSSLRMTRVVPFAKRVERWGCVEYMMDSFDR